MLGNTSILISEARNYSDTLSAPTLIHYLRDNPLFDALPTIYRNNIYIRQP